jgi:hypothetical protein
MKGNRVMDVDEKYPANSTGVSGSREFSNKWLGHIYLLNLYG